MVVATQDHYGDKGDLFFTDDALNADPSKIKFKAITADENGTALDIKSATDLVAVPGTPSQVYAGVIGAGVLRSADSGKTWSQVNFAFDTLKDSFDWDQDGNVTENLFLVSGGSIFGPATRIRLAATPKTHLRGLRQAFTRRWTAASAKSLIGLFQTKDLGANPTWHSLNLPGDPLDAVKVDLARDADTTAGNSPARPTPGSIPAARASTTSPSRVDFNDRAPDLRAALRGDLHRWGSAGDQQRYGWSVDYRSEHVRGRRDLGQHDPVDTRSWGKVGRNTEPSRGLAQYRDREERQRPRGRRRRHLQAAAGSSRSGHR